MEGISSPGEKSFRPQIMVKFIRRVEPWNFTD